MIVVSLGLGVAWGMILAWPIARRAVGSSVTRRARAVGSGRSRPTRGRLRASLRQAPVVRVGAEIADRRLRRRDASRLARELPVVADLLGVAVGAGANPTSAVALAARWAPPRSAAYLRSVSDAQANGAALADALELATADEPVWSPVVEALLATERLGAPIGPSLARLSETQRAELRREAEAHARKVPVRLLFPLVFLVLPAFGLLTVVPVLVSGLTTF